MEHVSRPDVPRNLEDLCGPRRMALLVFDMQVGLTDGLPQGPEVIACVAEVLGAAREGGYPVFFSRHTTLPARLMDISQLRRQMAWQRVERPEDVGSTFPREAPQTRIRPELEPLPDEAVFDKISFSALEGTLLNMARRNLGLESFAIVGVATEIGVEPTVRHATDLGYVPVVISDACGAVNEEAGRRALAVLEHEGDAMFTDTATISRLLREGGRATD